LESCGKQFSIAPGCTIVGAHNIVVGDNFNAYARLRLEAYDWHLGFGFSPQIIIGNNVCINYDCHIGCINKISIGNNVLIASKVFITDHFHGEIDGGILDVPPAQRKLFSKGSVIIEDNVWIGEAVAILPDVRIGFGSIIGANSVVTKSIPARSIACGIPARVIKCYE
jgi:acetyltransferase-like isoleucine patch superfamily enzyme